MTLKDKIHKIKESRISPAEKFLYPIFYDIKPYVSGKQPDTIFYKKDDEIFFQYNKKNGHFWCHNKIWEVLETNYELKYQDIRNLIKVIAQKTLKLKEVIPRIWFCPFCISVQGTLNLKEDSILSSANLKIGRM